MNIIIPSYEKHIKFNRSFLNSYDTHCLDKDQTKIYFVVDNHNIELFNDLKSYSFVEILNYDEIVYSIYKTKVKYIDKYSHQSLKKLLSILYIEKNAIVMDSENICIKNFYMSDIFKNIDNKIYYTENKTQFIQSNMINDLNNIIDHISNRWYFIKSYWYFDYEICKSLILYLEKKYSNTYEMLSSTIFFEYQLYCQFIEKNNITECIDIDSILDESLSESMKNSRIGNTNFEYICSSINDINIDKYCNLLDILGDRITRLHFMADEHIEYISNKTKIYIKTFHEE
jgi:hypothetical protein